MGQGFSNDDIDYNRPVDIFHMEALVKSKKEGKEKDTFIIDVRDKFEVNEHGSIPFSIHIPSEELRHALKLSSNEFKEKYGVRMPRKSDRIVFYDQRSGRASTATEIAKSMGHKYAAHFSEGYSAWQKKFEHVEREDL